jgi:hypothetical protein
MSGRTSCLRRFPSTANKLAVPVPAVGDLNGLRQGLPGSLSVCAGSVTRDHADTRVLCQPVPHLGHLAASDQIQGAVLLQVHTKIVP